MRLAKPVVAVVKVVAVGYAKPSRQGEYGRTGSVLSARTPLGRPRWSALQTLTEPLELFTRPHDGT